MAKKTEDAIIPVIVLEPTAAEESFLAVVLPHLINAVQVAYSGTSKVAIGEKGKTYVEINGRERLAAATALIYILNKSIPNNVVIDAIEKTLAEMKRNGTLVK